MSTWWENVERELVLPGDKSNLMIDGYLVTIMVSPISPLRNTLRIYIDGWFRGAWLVEDGEEFAELRRRFFRRSQRKIANGRLRREMQAERDKRRCPKHLRDVIDAQLARTLTMYRPDWTSFKELRKHLVRNNDSIEHVSRAKAEELLATMDKKESAA